MGCLLLSIGLTELFHSLEPMLPVVDWVSQLQVGEKSAEHFHEPELSRGGQLGLGED